MRAVRLLSALAAVALVTPAAADTIELPTSDAAQLAATELLKQLPNFRPDRLLPSDVPGLVINDEVVAIGIGGDGVVRRVELDQRLRLTGTGDYAVRERGPARKATPLGDDPPPITRRGAVVWQGFSPGSRDLAARLQLDPAIEAQHLPLDLRVAFRGADGSPSSLLPGGEVPGPGTVEVTVRNTTEQPAALPTAADAPAAALAPLLDRALAVARKPSGQRLLSTDAELPARVPVTSAAQVQASQAVPLRITGSLRLAGTTGTVTGPATSPLADGASFEGVLGGTGGTPEVTFTAQIAGKGRLLLDLTGVTALDPRRLAPPNGLPSWQAWAAGRPDRASRKAALDLLVEVAATGARASSFSPYLGAELAGSGSTEFRWAFAPAEATPVAVRSLSPRSGPIALVLLAFSLLLVNAGLLWRRL